MNALTSRIVCMLTVVAMAAFASSAKAGIPNLHIWFEAQPLNGDSVVVTQGASGQDTQLGCDTTGGPTKCEWRISTVVDTSALNHPAWIGSYGVDLLGDTARHTIDDGSVAPGDYPQDGWTISDSGGSGGLLKGYKRVLVPVNTPVADGTYTLMEFDISSNFAPGDMNLDGIDVAVNDLLIALVELPGPAGPALVQFGDAATVNGSNEGEVAFDVINFETVPEPTTALLLLASAGAVAVRRRRKA